MGNCCGVSSTAGPRRKALPIDSDFLFPSSIPNWPPGDGSFGSGYIDLGEGFQVAQITTFKKIWSSYEGGPNNLGASFYEPTLLRDSFFLLGSYAQPNNQQFFGFFLVGKDNNLNNTSSGTRILEPPIDYTLIYTTEYLDINQDGPAYVWLPIPPDNYKALGHILTTTNQKPPLDKIRCVRSDFTEKCENDKWICGGTSEDSESEYIVYSISPINRGTKAQGVTVGTFFFQDSSSLSCLKNNNFDLSSMPNLSQIQALVQTYSPFIYFHPNELYLPSSVNWFFSNGALLYQQGEESNRIEFNGSNLPQGGSNDETYWLDLPINEAEKQRVKQGDLQSVETYLHIKPMLGSTFTDIAIWIFYPFNGLATAKLGSSDIPLGIIGEHIGDWEHITLRISNFNGLLYKVYFSQHSGGTWVDTPSLEFQESTNKVVAYSSRNGHANYSQPGLVLQGFLDIGIRNDTSKSDLAMDVGARYTIVSGETNSLANENIIEPPWLNYFRKWGPKITYGLGIELEKLGSVLSSSDLKMAFESLVDVFPDEILGEDGPTGPKVKDSWSGDEV